jgi:hypothetical protein
MGDRWLMFSRHGWTKYTHAMDMPEGDNCPGTYQWRHFEELGAHPFPLNFRQSVWANVLPVVVSRFHAK